MKRPSPWIAGLAALTLTPLRAPASAQEAQQSPTAALPKLLVLGMVHFANPGRDQLNISVEDVLEPDRQAELATLVERLAAYRPTRIAVEWDVSGQPALDEAYAAWRAGDHSSRAERSQVAFRLADRLGHERVYAVDWQRPPPGDEADYDFVTWARDNGRGAEFDAALAPLAADNDALQKDMPCLTVSGWLARVNDPAVQQRNARSYYPIARLGDTTANRGAAWVGGSWYARNLTIWTNLAALVRSPDERVLLVIGSGHRPLIEHFAQGSQSFERVDPLDWLPRDERHREACQ